MGCYEYVATCLFGLEKFVADEIEKLGYEKLETIDGRVTFTADEDAIARFNIFSRYSERLYIKLGSFKATTFTELFDGVMDLPIECFIGKDDAFPVTGSSIKSKLFSIPDCQSIIKKAIVEKLLPVVDNFERGFSTVAEEDKDDAFVKGMEMVYKQMMTMLESVDVKPIEAVGQEFNPDLHNAVMHVEDETVGENIVVDEFQKGYTYRDSVVRYSMVKVAN